MRIKRRNEIKGFLIPGEIDTNMRRKGMSKAFRNISLDRLGWLIAAVVAKLAWGRK